MTNDALDLLERMSSPALAAQAEQDASRPFNRFAGRHFKADIPAQDLDIISRRVGNSNFDEWGMFLLVDVTEVYEGNVKPGEHQLWVRSANPTRRDGSENKNTKNSELVQMTNAAGMSPRQWPGNKGVTFKDAVYEYAYDRNTNVKDQNGKDIWERGVKGELWYYQLNFQAGSNNNGNATASAPITPTEEAIEKAISLLIGDGMAPAAFHQAVAKLKEPSLIGYVAGGQFVKDMTKAGRIEERDGLLVAV